MSDKSDRVAVNQEYRGSKSPHQDANVTGKPVKAPEKPSNLEGQVGMSRPLLNLRTE